MGVEGEAGGGERGLIAQMDPSINIPRSNPFLRMDGHETNEVCASTIPILSTTLFSISSENSVTASPKLLHGLLDRCMVEYKLI
jgi:hypothetical protein